jgi:plasmid maintenance system killer protein
MIETVGNRLVEDLFHGRRTKATRAFPPELLRTARREIRYLHDAADRNACRVPRGNRLEAARSVTQHRWLPPLHVSRHGRVSGCLV